MNIMEDRSEKKIKYRELQGIAKGMHLPGNLKYHLLVEIIEARKTGNEQVVDRILGEQKLERVRRKREKLEAREAAYQHLKISEERKLSSKYRKCFPSYSAPSTDESSTVKWKPTEQQRLQHQQQQQQQQQQYLQRQQQYLQQQRYEEQQKQYQLQKSLQYPSSTMRPVFTMSADSFHELMRTSREQVTHYTPTNQFFYSDCEERLGERVVVQNEAFLPDPFPTYKDNEPTSEETGSRASSSGEELLRITKTESPESSFDTQQPSIQPKTSFQMKDILGESENRWFFHESDAVYNSSFDTSTSSIGFTEPYIQHYPPYLPSSHHFRNIYELNQDSINWHFSECPPIQSQTRMIMEETSSPNSDTVSATEEEAHADSNDNYKNHVNLPAHIYYPSSEEQGSMDFEEQSFPMTELAPGMEVAPPIDRACKNKICVY